MPAAEIATGRLVLRLVVQTIAPFYNGANALA
jgi:hypothetical protein